MFRYIKNRMKNLDMDADSKNDSTNPAPLDYNMDEDGLWDVGPVNYDDDCDADGMPNWYEDKYGVANGGWQNPYIYNARYAVLIGGGDTDSSKNWACFWKDTKEMYKVLVNQYNYLPENVYLHFWNSKKGYKDEIYVDGPADWHVGESNQGVWGGGVKESLDTLENKMTKNDFLYLFMVAHGGKDPATGEKIGSIQGYDIEHDIEYQIYYASFTTAPSPPGEDNVLDIELNQLISARMVIVSAACDSGTAIKGRDNEPDKNLKGENRIIITSTDRAEPSFCWYGNWPDSSDDYDHQEFLWNEDTNGFVRKLKESGVISLKTAFDSGKEAALDDEWYTAQWDASHAQLYEWSGGMASYTYL